MTTTMPTTVRRPRLPWIPVLLATLMIAALFALGVRMTWDPPVIPIQIERAQPAVAPATVERAARLAAARQALTTLRAVVREVPAAAPAVHDDIQLLAAVGAGLVPIQALDAGDADRAALESAVRAGHVPAEALTSTR